MGTPSARSATSPGATDTCRPDADAGAYEVLDEIGRSRRAVVLRVRRHGTEYATTAGALAVSISLGVAHLEDSDTGVGALLVRADRSLYLAKGAGRNRVHVAAPDSAGGRITADRC